MKVMIATTPLRPIPTPFPPLGSLSIINYLRKNDVDGVEFFNIDAQRPTYEEALAHIVDFAPDLLRISAVVSTAYAYTKRLADDVKARLPDTLIVVGGNLAGSAEIILRKTGTDLCVLGEGERVFLDIVGKANETLDPHEFKSIPGLMLLGPDGDLINTGFPRPLDKTEIYDVCWDDLETSSDISIFFHEVFDENGEPQDWLRHDPRAQDPKRSGKKLASLPGSKGCVARCTFCHRWDKGIRYIPVDLIMRRLDEVIERYDVGFLKIVDENFGTSRHWLEEFCQRIKPYDILWHVGGMRVNCITSEQVEMMKDAGCVSILYGMETGSPKMLQVMEKKTKLEDNRNAMKWTVGANLWTGVQLVLGMPGETPQTVRETIDFCKYALTLDPGQNPNDLSINYAQALPGTPFYEFGRHMGLIGRTIDEEEAYLLSISDSDAHDELTTLNFTDSPRLTAQTWRPLITVEVNYHFVRTYGLDHYRRKLLADANFFDRAKPDSGYFANPKRLVDTSSMTDSVHGVKQAHHLESDEFPGLLTLIRQGKLGLALICYPVLAYRARHFLGLLVLFKAFRDAGLAGALSLLADYVRTTGNKLIKTG